MPRSIRLPPLSNRLQGFAPRFCAPDSHSLKSAITVYAPRNLHYRLFITSIAVKRSAGSTRASACKNSATSRSMMFWKLDSEIVVNH